jgi:tetratricopeptide (TPR) repeat protein
VHEVDLGMDEEPPKKRSRGGIWLLVFLFVAAGGAVAVFLAMPGLFAPAPPPAPKVDVAAVTIEVKPAEPAPAPVPAPEPVVQPPIPPSPEPVAKPAPEKPAGPKGPKAILARAQALLEKGDAEAALELFGRLASDDPSNVEALTGRGLCYLDLESYAPAEASFQAALRLEPSDPDAMLGLAESYRFQGKKAEAISQYESYLARHPGGDDAEVAKNALEQLRK